MNSNINMLTQIYAFLATIFTFAIISVALYYAVKILGGKTTFKEVLLVNVLCGFGLTIVAFLFPIGSVFAFVALILIYRHFFKIGWFRAILAWLLQAVILLIFLLILIKVFGLSSY